MVRLPAPGWFCTITVGLPGMCAEVAGERPRVDVVARADADADDDAERFSFVEIGDILLRRRRGAATEKN